MMMSNVSLVGETNARPFSVEKAQKLNPSETYASLRFTQSERECVCVWEKDSEREGGRVCVRKIARESD